MAVQLTRCTRPARNKGYARPIENPAFDAGMVFLSLHMRRWAIAGKAARGFFEGACGGERLRESCARLTSVTHRAIMQIDNKDNMLH